MVVTGDGVNTRPDLSIERLKRLSDVLANLMRDPHPGLFSWQDSVHASLSGLAAFRHDVIRASVPSRADAMAESIAAQIEGR